MELEATITFVEPKAGLLFVHDGTAGVFVHSGESLDTLSAGMRLFLRGTAQQGRVSPVILSEGMESRGEGKVPVAETTTTTRVNAGGHDSQWVELNGIVRRDGPSWFHRVLEVYDGDAPVYVRLKDFDQLAPASLLDARVQVRGVVANHFSETNRPPGFTLYVPHPNHLRIIRPPAADPFATPLVAVDRLAAWPGVDQLGHLKRVRGVATFQLPGRWLALRDGETPLIIEATATNRLEPGTEIEAAGFVRQGGGQIRLVEASWRPTGRPVAAVQPRTAVGWPEIAAAPPGQLIEVTGVLRGINGREAIFQCDQALLPVIVRDAPPPDWVLNAEYRVSGTLMSTQPDSPAAGRFLWVTDPAAARLIGVSDRPVAGWVATKDVVWLSLFMAVVAGWWWQQRRQKGILDEMEAALAFNRAQLVRAEHEQARISRDLHDGVIQSIYAVGMRIEECRRLADTSPAIASEKLATTSEVLNDVIREVRGFLTGLEPASIQGRELRTALKSVVLGLGDEAADRIALKIDPATAESLSSREATELFHICKEALSNSLRHGHASRVVVSLQPRANGWFLEIADDGAGFDPATVSPESRGLQNLRTRARNLGARLQLNAAPGSGTRLSMVMPDALKL